MLQLTEREARPRFLRLYILLWILLVLCAAPGCDRADAACDPCEKHTLYARFGQQVQVAAPGETVPNEVTIRNADSCGCPATCWTFSTGYHPPHDSSPGLAISRTQIRAADGGYQPPFVCLAPGEEHRAEYLITVAAGTTAPGFVTPNMMFVREGARFTAPDIYVDVYDLEGGALCVGYATAACADKVYAPQVPQ